MGDSVRKLSKPNFFEKKNSQILPLYKYKHIYFTFEMILITQLQSIFRFDAYENVGS